MKVQGNQSIYTFPLLLANQFDFNNFNTFCMNLISTFSQFSQSNSNQSLISPTHYSQIC